MTRTLLLALLLVLSACSRPSSQPNAHCNELDAGAPIDPVLLAFLSRARAAHHLADDHEAEGDLSAAASPLTGLVAGPFPHANGAELAPEVREVLADTRARLADLHSRQGAFASALSDVRAGLELVPSSNYFRGHLLETEGLVEERHAKAIQTSDPDAAAALRKRAIALLEQAMAVQSEVLRAVPDVPNASVQVPVASALPTLAPLAPPAPNASAR